MAAELVLDRVTPGEGEYPSVIASARAYAANNTIHGAVTTKCETVKSWVRILHNLRSSTL